MCMTATGFLTGFGAILQLAGLGIAAAGVIETSRAYRGALIHIAQWRAACAWGSGCGRDAVRRMYWRALRKRPPTQTVQLGGVGSISAAGSVSGRVTPAPIAADATIEDQLADYAPKW
jgi:hypothetical protein